MHIFAHRGLLEEYPENSLTALIEAVKRGYAIETDLRLTKDGDFVIIHDDNFERLAEDARKVAQLTVQEIENIPYINSTERFISLKTFLDAINKLDTKPQLALHLKADSQNNRAYQKLSDYWKKYELHNHAFVFDLTRDAAQNLKQVNPEIKIAYIISETKFEHTINLWDEVKDDPHFDIVWAAEYRHFYSQTLLAEMKSKKKTVYCMSPDVHTALGHPLAYHGYEETWKKLINWHIDGICTDKPEKLKNLEFQLLGH